MVALAVISAGAPGCIDLVPVEPPVERPATLDLVFRLSGSPQEGGTPLVEVSAVLDPGVDRTGADREVLDSDLVLEEHVLQPVEIRSDRALLYSGVVPIEAEHFQAGIRLVAPELGAVGGPSFEFTWPHLVPAGPTVIDVVPGRDLVLDVDRRAFPGMPEPISTRWSVSLFGEDGWSSRGGNGVPPEAIRVPGATVLAVGREIVAVVNLNQSLVLVEEAGRYVARIEQVQQLQWMVEIESPSAGDPAGRKGHADVDARPGGRIFPASPGGARWVNGGPPRELRHYAPGNDRGRGVFAR